MRVRQEEVPEALLLSFVFCRFKCFQLARVIAPRVGFTFTKTMELFAHRVHDVLDESFHVLIERACSFGHTKIVHLR